MFDLEETSLLATLQYWIYCRFTSDDDQAEDH